MTASEWHCTLEPPAEAGPHAFAVRMGLRWVRGITTAEGDRIAAARAAAAFESIEDVVRRCALSRRTLDALAEAGALGALNAPGGDSPEIERRDALWQVAGFVRRKDDEIALAGAADDHHFAALTELDEIVWDYQTSSHSVRGHPLGPLRGELRARGWPDARTVSGGRDGQRLDYVGIVICRQQPGTAGGVTFMTLEDETGFVNLVVWARVFEQFALIARTASLLGVTGRLQVQEKIVHVIADRLWIPRLSRAVAEVDSHDFH